jgi:hypothetical protein
VRLTVYDVAGRIVRELFNGEKNSGRHAFHWNLATKSAVPTGVYLIRLSSENRTSTSKVIVQR